MGLRSRIATPRGLVTPEGTRLSRPVSFVAGSSGVSIGQFDPHAVDQMSLSAVAYRCVQAITNPLAALNLGVRRDTPQGPGDLNLMHPVARLWNRLPNPSLSAWALRSIVWQQMEMDGEAFVYLDRGETGEGEVEEFWPIFDRVDVVASKEVNGAVAGYVVNIGGKKVPLLKSEVLWLRYPHPRNPWAALAPWKAARWAADLDSHARAWQQGEFQNGARPEGIFYLGDVDEETHNKAVEEWRSRHVGARNALKHLFVSGPEAATYARVGLTPAEMSYIESRAKNAEEVMLAFGVHPDLLRGGATYENQRAAKVNLWTENLGPKTEVVQGEFDRQLLPDEWDTAVFDLSTVEALSESADSRSSRVRELMYTDVLLVDEGRAMMGLDALPGNAGQMTLTAYRATAERDILGYGVGPDGGGRANAELDVLSKGYRPTFRGVRSVVEINGERAVAVDADAIDRAYARGETIIRKAVVRLAAKQEKVVLRRLGDGERRGRLESLRRNDSQPPWTDQRALDRAVREAASDVFDRPYWADYTRDALEAPLAAVYDAGATMTADALGLSFDVFDDAVTDLMRARLDDLAGQITDTTYEVIRTELLAEGVAGGESIPDLADRIKARFEDLATWRAETIARTEAVGGHNAASRTAAVESGVVTRRRWLATRDTRTRDTHVSLDGHTTEGLEDAYPNGCMFPGDPAGPADETVNCRCVETFILPA